MAWDRIELRIRQSIRLYDLRHTCATLLLLVGVSPKVVAERLGHATITLTIDVYSHVLPTMQEAATEKLERMLFAK
ncbi:MAG TPA: tyrosine-type recombinase/integrase [Pyrinomonadaceae bacterium]|jgi:integrase